MRRFRFARWLIVLSALAVLGAACAQDGGDGDDGAQAPTGDDPRNDEIGFVEIGEGQPLQLAAIQTISGDTASLGEDQVRAIEIAINDRGGELMGHQIELQVEDGECSAEGGTAAAQAIVADPQVVGIIGTSCSGAGVPASQIMSEAGLVMISGSNTSPFLTSLAGEEGTDHHPGYYRTAHNDEVQGQAAAEFMFNELGVEQAASIHDGDPYTQGLAGVFNDSFEELGGQVVVATAVSPEDTNMRPVLTEIAGAGAQGIFFPIFQPAGDFIVQQAGDVQGLEETAMMGADGLLSDTFVEIPETKNTPPGPGGDQPGMYFSGPATPEGGEYDEFVQKYRDEYGEAPIQSFHAHAYDATNMLLDAIESVAVEENGTLLIGRQALRDALQETDLQGLTGNIVCDEFGDCADPRIHVVQNTEDTQDIEAVRANVLFEFVPEEE